MKVALALLAALLLSTSQAVASPLDAWGGATGKGMLVINPNVGVTQGGVVDGSLVLSYGPSERFDILVQAGLSGGPNTSPAFDGLEVLPRFFLHESVGLALHAAWTPGSGVAQLGPELHLSWSRDAFSLYSDVGWAPEIGDTFDPGTVFGRVALEGSPVPFFSVFVETTAEVNITDRAFGLQVTPGLGFTLDQAGLHEISAGVRVPAWGDLHEVHVGAWYSVAIDTRARRTRTTDVDTDDIAVASVTHRDG